MRRRPAWPWIVLGVLVAVSAFARWLGARGVPSPWFTPDEQTYGLIGEGLWRHGSYEILGHKPQFLSLVYPALVGAPLSLHDVGRPRTRRDTGERNRMPELRKRHGWAWSRLFRRYDTYALHVAALEDREAADRVGEEPAVLVPDLTR